MSNQVIPTYIYSNQDWGLMYPREGYVKKTPHSMQNVLHYLLGLNQSDNSIISCINKFKASDDAACLIRLVKQDSKNHCFTPLIIATMRGRVVVVRALLEFGKATTGGLRAILEFGKATGRLEEAMDMKDQYGWTALHHASLCSPVIFELLKSYGASLQAKTPFQGTPADLQTLSLRNVTSLCLDRIFFEDPDSGQLHALSLLGQKMLCDKTGLSAYQDAPFVAPSEYKTLWKGKMEKNQEVDQKNHEYCFGNPIQVDFPFLVIGKSLELREESRWEVRAKELIPYGTVIGEYAGNFVADSFKPMTLEEWHAYIKANLDDHLLKPTDAALIGNVTRWFKWGWPNCSVFSSDTQGLHRNYFLATEREGIQAQEPLLWDYGLFHPRGLFAPFTIFEREKMEEYFKKGLKCLVEECIESNKIKRPDELFWKKSNQIAFIEGSILMEKIVFPLNAPAALLDLHFNDIVMAKEWLVYLEKLDASTLPSFIFEWRAKYGWQAGLICSVLYRIEELENTLEASPNKREQVVQWILSRIGTLSVVDLLKGMEIIGEEIHEKEWEDIENLDKTLAGYDWTQDLQAPIGIERHAHDLAKIYLKSYGSDVLEKLRNMRSEFVEYYGEISCISLTLMDRMLEILEAQETK